MCRGEGEHRRPCCFCDINMNSEETAGDVQRTTPVTVAFSLTHRHRDRHGVLDAPLRHRRGRAATSARSRHPRRRRRGRRRRRARARSARRAGEQARSLHRAHRRPRRASGARCRRLRRRARRSSVTRWRCRATPRSRSRTSRRPPHRHHRPRATPPPPRRSARGAPTASASRRAPRGGARARLAAALRESSYATSAQTPRCATVATRSAASRVPSRVPNRCTPALLSVARGVVRAARKRWSRATTAPLPPPSRLPPPGVVSAAIPTSSQRAHGGRGAASMTCAAATRRGRGRVPSCCGVPGGGCGARVVERAAAAGRPRIRRKRQHQLRVVRVAASGRVDSGVARHRREPLRARVVRIAADRALPLRQPAKRGTEAQPDVRRAR